MHVCERVDTRTPVSMQVHTGTHLCAGLGDEPQQVVGRHIFGGEYPRGIARPFRGGARHRLARAGAAMPCDQ